MTPLWQRLAGAVLRGTGLQYWPVRVRSGLPAGARWTLYPWTSYWRSGYEPLMERAILSLGDITGRSCWDLGAHYGYYSVGFALRVGPAGSIAAFEPLESSYARLERHRRMNGLTWLRTFPLAASDTSGSAELFTDASAGDTAVHLAYEGEIRNATTPTRQVRTVRLDDLVRSGEIVPPDIVKVDVEGHGHRALAGAIQALRAKRPVILMGFHSPQEVDGTRGLLAPLGYSWEPLTPGGAGDPVGHDFLLRPV